MWRPDVNKKLLPMKLSFFMLFVSIGPMAGFMSTWTRQLGYTVNTFGTMMMFVSLILMFETPIIGIINDKFRVKRKLYLTAMLTISLVSVMFMFVPKLPSGTIAVLKCDPEAVLVIGDEGGGSIMQTTSFGKNDNDTIICELNCQKIRQYEYETNQSDNRSELSSHQMTVNIDNPNASDLINITFNLNDTKRIGNSYIFNVLSMEYDYNDDANTRTKYCRRNFNRNCRLTNCSSKVIMDIGFAIDNRGNVLKLYQFWILFIVIVVFYSSIKIVATLQNSICLDLLGNESEDYGKQKCWSSVGWGISSILIGGLIDLISIGKQEKNYSLIFYSCMTFTLCNFFVSTKITVIESKKVKGKSKSIYKLFTKYHVIAFYVWSSFNAFYHSIITHFLFWYIEDMVLVNNEPSQRAWIKTLQGLVQGVQCFGGEIPFYFWSGYIIRKMGHINCMALVLGATAFRMFFYTVISNPTWIILIELLNGVSYALGYSVQMSYAKILAPPETINTIIGLLGLVDFIGEAFASLIGGYLFQTHGGLWLFRFIACTSAFLCIMNVISNHFGLTKDLANRDFNTIPVKSDGL